MLLAKHIFLVELKDCSPVCRQRIREGVWLAIALALLGAGGECMLAALTGISRHAYDLTAVHRYDKRTAHRTADTC